MNKNFSNNLSLAVTREVSAERIKERLAQAWLTILEI